MQEAIALLLERGASVEYRGFHIYQSKLDGYVILNFNAQGNMMLDEEESFDNMCAAIRRFMEKAGL